jgi:F-type H+-transporting ATPase subunit b
MRKNRIQRLLEVLIGDRKRRFAVLGGVAFATFVSGTALAQEHPQGHAAPAGEAPAAGTAPAGAAPSHPAGGHEEGAAAHEGGHEAGHEGGHAVHEPAPFNFADFGRFDAEKKAEAAGKGHAPVTPFIYLIINAAILFSAYYYFGKKPVSEGLAARRATVARELDDAAKVKSEAEDRLEDYKKRLAAMDKELQVIREEIITSGEKERDRIVKEAEEKAERMRKDAHFLLEQEMKQLRNEMIRHAVDAATGAAEQVLRTKLTQADHDRIGDEFLAQLASAKSAGQSKQGGVA